MGADILERCAHTRVVRSDVGNGTGRGLRRVQLGEADPREHGVQADRRLPAAEPSAAAARPALADREVPDLAGEALGAAHQAAALDEPGADTDGAGEVEQVIGVAAGAVVELGERTAVGVVADPGQALPPERVVDRGGQRRTGDPEVGGPGDGAVVLGDQAGYGDRGADRVRAVVAQQGGHLVSEPGKGRLDFPDVGDGAGHPMPDRAGQVDDHCGDVLDVGLEADTHRPAAGQGQPKPGPAAVATAHLLCLTDRAGLLEVTDDRAHRGLGQAGASGELGAAGRPVVAQRPEHRRGIAAPDVRLRASHGPRRGARARAGPAARTPRLWSRSPRGPGAATRAAAPSSPPRPASAAPAPGASPRRAPR